jgi:GNAT superfamily N-acetyltransferase
MQFKIRQATRKDINTIYDFIKGLAIYEKLENEFIATHKELEQTIFDNNYANVLIGNEVDEAQNETPVCFALYFFNYSTFLGKPGIYLEDLFVIPEKRSLGYGTKMLKELVNIALTKNCGRVEWSVLNWNSPAIKVYEGIGAKPQSEWTVYRLTENEMINFTK